MALQLVIHTFRMIFGNLGQALRISIGPFLIAIGVAFLAFSLAGVPMTGNISVPVNAVSPAAALIPFLLLPLFLFVFAWVAVSWHRFILLEEYAGFLPAIGDRPIWPYVGKSILLSLIILALIIPLMFVFSGLLVSTATTSIEQMTLSTDGTLQVPPQARLTTIIANLVFSIPIYFVMLRLGVALVGTALGKPMGFGDAWRATSSVSGIVFGVAVIMTVINLIPGLLIGGLYSTAPALAEILNLIITWVTLMVGISILTTIYGHVIEERPLPN